LKALKKKKQSEQFLEEVIEALGKIKDKRALIPLARMAKSENSEIAHDAAVSLGKIVKEHKPVSDKKLLAEIQKTYRDRVISRADYVWKQETSGSREESDHYRSTVMSQLRSSLYTLLGFNERDYHRINRLLKPLDDVQGPTWRFKHRLKRFVIAESIFFRSDLRRNIPKNNADRDKVRFWVSLRKDAEQRELDEVIEAMTSKKHSFP
jgi:hypothetical protein